ncbi:nucleotidyltransferase substrate binding protein [Echinicola vietnamensis]|uniref:Nucleotidyltransferase family protein n=1 Tax=Echinicola vietnamensis (strain DSM 17526 / LMG 23754 / KMM 6221) TaxID=926556 RepID=L0G751_ECHVK|nr:nucleotidyltransferase substrate binding protein [Echinicola vietnamensis]AGA80841.1 nucleotidyltransferase family protein [Echinicola vietnamensis DSM 17526]
MKTQPLNCEQCFNNFQDSLSELQEVIEEINLRGVNPKNEQHLHRSFELTHELALNAMSEYFRKQGRPPYSGSRDITLDAFNEELIDDGKGWLDMIICRIKATPVYTEDVHKNVSQNILKNYIHLFENFEKKMKMALDQ